MRIMGINILQDMCLPRMRDAERLSKLCAPRKANVDKPANPARTKPNQQFGTEPGTRGGNETCEALGKECVSRNASEGIEPRKRHNNALGQRIHFSETSIDARVKGECASACRGPSPRRAYELSTLELGRTGTRHTKAAKELKKQHGGTAFR